MKIITSSSNPLYKDLALIASKNSARKKQKLTILDGISLLNDYLDRVGSPEICVFSEESAEKPAIKELTEKCCTANVLVIQLSEKLFQNIAPVETSFGICFLVKIPQNRVAKNSAMELKSNAVLLESIQDPGNLGSIIRSAAAAGIEEIFCSKGTVSAFSPKVLRSAMGAQFFVKVYEDVVLESLVERSKISIYATGSHEPNSIYEEDLSEPIAWLFGNEGQGISDQLMKLSTKRVIIPQLGDVESLNVSIAAAICFFEQSRQIISKKA